LSASGLFQTYRVFWKWSDATVDYAMLQGKLWTVFGYRAYLQIQTLVSSVI
jgi:hypothetical protein